MGDTNVIVYMVGPGMVFIVKLFVLLMAIALMIFVKRSNVNLVSSVMGITVVITMRLVETYCQNRKTFNRKKRSKNRLSNFKNVFQPNNTKSFFRFGQSVG